METRVIKVNGEEVEIDIKLDEDYIENNDDFYDEFSDTIDLSNEVDSINDMEIKENE